MTTLNDTFETKHTQKDEGYESGSDYFNIPTPLSRAPRIYHVFTMNDLSFNPVNFGQSPTTPEQHAESSPCRYRNCNIACHQLVFTSSDDKSPVWPRKHHSQHSKEWWQRSQCPGSRHFIFSTPQLVSPCHTHHGPVLTEAWDDDTTSFEEHFPTPPLDDDIWAEEPNLDRCLCIHKRPNKPNNQCYYPCPYDSTIFSMDLLQSMPQNEAVFNYEQMTSVTSHQIFQISWWQWVTLTFLILQMFQMHYGSHKHSQWLFLQVKNKTVYSAQ